MLPAHNRMRTSGEFRAAIKGGTRGSSQSLMVHLRSPDSAETADRAPALVGFVVPKTVGNAVIRNRIRRQLRHIMRDRLGVLESGQSLVIRVFPQAKNQSADMLASDLDRAWAKAARGAR